MYAKLVVARGVLGGTPLTWDTISDNWQQALEHLKTRFPLLDPSSVTTPPESQSALEHYVAKAHDLTPIEASEEVGDWIFVVSLARIASEIGHELSDQ